jgi:hypothetical protein
MKLFSAIDALFWDDRFEEFRFLVTTLVLVVAAIYFGHALVVSVMTR